MSNTETTLLLWLDEAAEIERAMQPNLPRGLRILRASSGERPPPQHLAQADIVFAWDVPAGILSQMPKLRWIQAATAGVENWVKRADLPQGVILTCARGIHRVQMPENILGALFHLTKDFARCRESQEAGRWDRFIFDLLAGKTLGIVGLGAIGAELARKAAALEMHVIGTRKHPAPVPFVEQVYGFEDLDLMLARSDFVVLLIPVTPETDGMIDRRRLAHMKPTAWLLNFARGEHVVDEDLIQAVATKQIAGALLDAFRQEPLPPGHPFWSTPNIVMLPHVGGRHPEKNKVFGELLVDNIGRLLANEPLQGLVDPRAGY